jgi:CRP/FNR family transcriptional regulator, cyclic AMP receptor protein
MAHPLQAFFSQIPLFSGLAPDELNDLLRAVRPMNLAAGERLFSQGDAGDAAYVVQTGAVQVFTQRKGEEVLVATLGAGQVLGELSLLDGSPRSASVRAAEDAALFRLDKAEFDFLRRNLRPAAFKLMRSIAVTLCDRLRETNDHIGRLIAPPVEAPEAAAAPTRTGSFFARLLFRGGKS